MTRKMKTLSEYESDSHKFWDEIISDLRVRIPDGCERHIFLSKIRSYIRARHKWFIHPENKKFRESVCSEKEHRWNRSKNREVRK